MTKSLTLLPTLSFLSLALLGCGAEAPSGGSGPAPFGAGGASTLGGGGAQNPMASGGSGPANPPTASSGGSSSEANPMVTGIGNGGAGGASSATGGIPATAGAGGAVQAGTPLPSAPLWEGCPAWPAANGQLEVGETMEISGTFDGEMQRFIGEGDLGQGDQEEGQPPIFELANNAVLRNVILGSPAADGIHCNGSCTLENVWWEDVGEDAATFLGTSDATEVNIDCGGARGAADKVLQHNGGGTVVINQFIVEDFGKLYRSCGNCDEAFDRHVRITNVIGRAPGTSLVGINSNFGDTATLNGIFLHDPTRSITICERYEGNENGDEPILIGTGPDPEFCQYQVPSVTFIAAQ